MNEPLADDEVRELAGAFYARATAVQLLENAGLPRGRQPSWDGHTALGFWREISNLLSRGIIPDGRVRILAAARDYFPHNAVFAVAAASPGERTVPRQDQETVADHAPHEPRIAAAWQRYAVVDHDRLFGVSAIVDAVIAAMCSHSGSHLVSLFGDGGIGKTTVAYEAARACMASGKFARAAWASAKNLADAATQSSGTAYWLEVVRDIASQLKIELSLSRALWERDLARGLRQFSPDRACLVVVDNLESTDDAQEAVERLAAGTGRSAQSHRNHAVVRSNGFLVGARVPGSADETTSRRTVDQTPRRDRPRPGVGR